MGTCWNQYFLFIEHSALYWQKHEKMMSASYRFGCVGGQILSDQLKALQKLFFKLTSPVEKR